MKKHILLLIIFLSAINIFTQNNFILSLKVKMIDQKNYVWECDVATFYNSINGKGTHNISQFILTNDTAFGNNKFKIDTVLIPENDKKNYIILKGTEDTEKPIKLIEKEDYNSLINKIDNDKDKKFLNDLYKEKGQYFILEYPHGKTKTSTAKKVRDIIEKAGYKYEKIIAWKISYKNIKITGTVDNDGTILDLKIGDKSLAGDYDLTDFQYKLDNIAFSGETKLGSIKYKYGDNKFECDTNIDSEGGYWLIQYDYKNLPQITDEAFIVFLLNAFFFDLICRY